MPAIVDAIIAFLRGNPDAVTPMTVLLSEAGVVFLADRTTTKAALVRRTTELTAFGAASVLVAGVALAGTLLGENAVVAVMLVVLAYIGVGLTMRTQAWTGEEDSTLIHRQRDRFRKQMVKLAKRGLDLLMLAASAVAFWGAMYLTRIAD